MTKEELNQYFIIENHTLDQCAEHFGYNVSKIRKLLRKYNIKKIQKVNISEEALYNYYIVSNHTYEECMKYFNISKTCFFSKIKAYNIYKPGDLKKENNKSNVNKININKEDIIHYYIDLNYTLSQTAKELRCSTKSLTRRLKEYGIKKDTHKRFENISNSFQEHYGYKSPAQVECFKNKMKQTNLEKYGVPYACMREEFHKFKGSDSKPNIDFEEKLKILNIKYEREFPLGSYLYDFKIGNILIEINPTITHNSTFGIYNSDPKSSKYHIDKSNIAKDNGYHCVHVFDWDDQDKIIKTFLVTKEKVYARKCTIFEISSEEANVFLDQYHLQGVCRGNVINIGLFYENELVMIMCFGKPRYNKKYQWELLRLCSSYNVIGGAEKIMDYFKNKHKPESIVSYCDIAKFDGVVYDKLCFVLDKKSSPCRHWYYLGKEKDNHRIHITDNFLRQRGFDQLFNKSFGKGTSNVDLMIQEGYVEIYDCGQQTWVWKEN